MALARALSVTLTGVHGQLVDVEVDAASGVPGVTLVGLGDTAVSEAKDRVRAAIGNSAERWRSCKVTINLSPASVRKRGSGFDLALACACLAAFEELPSEALHNLVLVAELGLDGTLRPVRGILPMVIAALEAGHPNIVVAEASGREAALVPGSNIWVAASLREVVAVLRGREEPRAVDTSPIADHDVGAPDLADVHGQAAPRLAIEVAAAGAHHIFLHGAPGAGKTLLAERLPGLLPALQPDESLEVTAVHSVAGVLNPSEPMVVRPPFQSPHHTASAASLVGGGAGVAKPGAVSLAHKGVLFLDEAPEFAAQVVETLRQPMERGEVWLSRSEGVVRYPAQFLLVMAANPCPCGRSGGRSNGKGLDCNCTPQQKRRYRSRLSGPLMDRVDLSIPVLPVSRAELMDGRGGESSFAVRDRVQASRERAAHRFRDVPYRVNSELPGRELRTRFRPTADGHRLISDHLSKGGVSARGVDRVLRVAWTLADLAGIEQPGVAEVAGAIGLRGGGVRWAA